MAEDAQQIVKAIKGLKQELSALYKQGEVPQELSTDQLIKYMIDEREKTNRMLASITDKLIKFEKQIEAPAEEAAYSYMQNREVPLSKLDSDILNFIQSQPNSMTCADNVKEVMHYKGRNAACARLNKLYKEGLLDRLQLGHKVYYKFDAGKTTNTLIISPPQ